MSTVTPTYSCNMWVSEEPQTGRPRYSSEDGTLLFSTDGILSTSNNVYAHSNQREWYLLHSLALPDLQVPLERYEVLNYSTLPALPVVRERERRVEIGLGIGL